MPLSGVVAVLVLAQSLNWPTFRGNDATGIADGQNAPVTWDAVTGVNVLWRTPIAGLGHSSPVIWGERVFLTSAVSQDPSSIFVHGLDGRIDRRTDRAPQSFRVYCLDKRSGEILWERFAYEGVPKIQRHPKNSYASSTPATDGEHVAFLFGSEGLYVYDFAGRLLWKQDLGVLDAGASYDVTYQWGTASSPIIYKGLVIVQCDGQKDSFIAAFDVRTGKAVWRTPRPVISSFSTPLVFRGKERVELVANGPDVVYGYDPLTGRELWKMSGSSKNTTPTPFAAHGLIYVASGYRIRPIFAIRPGAVGDISLKEGATSSEWVAWSTSRDGPYMATPIVYGDYFYSVSFNGALTCYDARTGERLYEVRLGDKGGAYSASPIAADGRIYFTSEDGEVLVVRAGPKYELMATNPMGEVAMATPAISAGRIFVRTVRHLFSIGPPSARN